MYSAYYLFFAVSSLISFYPVGEDLQKNLLIDTVKFVTQFKEAPCNQWLRFRASDRKDMVSAPIGGLLFFIFVLDSIFFLHNISFFCFNQVKDEKTV